MKIEQTHRVLSPERRKLRNRNLKRLNRRPELFIFKMDFDKYFEMAKYNNP